MAKEVNKRVNVWINGKEVENNIKVLKQPYFYSIKTRRGWLNHADIAHNPTAISYFPVSSLVFRIFVFLPCRFRTHKRC